MAITNESQLIDITAISNGCSIIEEAASDYTKCAKKVNEAAAICTDKALSVEKKSLQPSLEDLGQSIGTIQGNVEFFTSQVRNVAMQIYNKQYAELTEYRAELARREAEAKAAAEKQAAEAAAAANANG